MERIQLHNSRDYKERVKKMDELKKMIEKLDESEDGRIIRQICAILYRYNEKHKGGVSV